MTIQPVPISDILRIRQEVMYPGLSVDEVRLEDDGAGEHLGLFRDGRLVTIVSLFRKDNRLQFRKLATLANQQGKGYGKEMMKRIMEKAAQERLEAVWCNARVSVAPFYYAFGMRESGASWEKHGIQFIKMEIKLQ